MEREVSQCHLGTLPRTIALTGEGSAWLQVLFKVWSLSYVSVSCLLSIQDSINQTLKWHIGVVETQCWASCGGSRYHAHRTPSQPVMSSENDRAGPSPQTVWDTLVSHLLGLLSFWKQPIISISFPFIQSATIKTMIKMESSPRNNLFEVYSLV